MKNTKLLKTILIGCITLTLAGCSGAASNPPDGTTPESENVENTDGSQDTDSQDGSNSETAAPEKNSSDDSSTDKSQNTSGEDDTDEDDFINSHYNDYLTEGGEIAFITDVSQIDDGTYNATVFQGIELYAQGAGVSYSYYIASDDTVEAYQKVVDTAIRNNSKLIIVAGVNYNSIIGEYQYEYPSISFLMIDGHPADEEGNEIDITSNVHCVAFEEHEAGYLAGYMSVLDGYTQFGFIGGQQVPPVERYGHGYLQGINDAAANMAVADNISVNYWYSDSFLPNDDIATMAKDWYSNGTEVIFACGGSIYESIVPAAEKAKKKVIGVDVDQSDVSDCIITSAMKGIETAVVIALDDYFAFNGWSPETSGQQNYYGIEDKCPSLPVSEWRFECVSLSDYHSLYSKLRKEEIVVNPTLEDGFKSLDIKVIEF